MIGRLIGELLAGGFGAVLLYGFFVMVHKLVNKNEKE